MQFRWYVPKNGEVGIMQGKHRTFTAAVRGMTKCMVAHDLHSGRIYRLEGNPPKVTGLVAKVQLNGSWK